MASLQRHDPRRLALRLLAWYDRHGRTLPWRAPPGRTPDPYAVWLSEIMLQQTTTATVGPYYRAFLKRWPNVRALAAAELDEVLRAWAGLGYYARARNLHACARDVAAAGGFPDEETELRRLPGVGPYTAAAVAAIAFGRRATVVDGNVERVIARLHGVATPLPAAKAELRRLAARLTPAKRPGDYAQAIMDLGATVCLPRRPNCPICPWAGACAARAAGTAEVLPARVPKAAKPTRHAVAFWAVRHDGSVLLRRRPERGLLGGMIEVPSTDWRAAPWTYLEAKAAAPVAARWRRLDGVVRHGFTHFDLEVGLLAARVRDADRVAGLWCPPDRLGDHALPTLMQKIARHALDDGTGRRGRNGERTRAAGRRRSSSHPPGIVRCGGNLTPRGR